MPELAQPLTEERVAIPGEGIPDRLSDSELLMA